jgi:MFS family permease
MDLAQGASVRRARLRDYLSLLHIRSYVLDTLGMAAMTFAIGGFAYWMPAFLKLHQVADLQMPAIGAIRAVTLFGGITALSGLIATLLGGILGDRLRLRFPGSYFIVSGVAMLIAFPMILGVIFVPYPWGWAFVFLAVFCLFFNTGPTNTILANVTHPSVRATGFALNILVIHALGDAISPTIIGFVADLHLRSSEAADLDLGFILISVMSLLGGLLWLWGARYLERDTALAPTRLSSETNGGSR